MQGSELTLPLHRKIGCTCRSFRTFLIQPGDRI
jgi:hypothetical protein